MDALLVKESLLGVVIVIATKSFFCLLFFFSLVNKSN